MSIDENGGKYFLFLIYTQIVILIFKVFLTIGQTESFSSVIPIDMRLICN